MQICVLIVNCLPNHTKCFDISPHFVIASTKKNQKWPPPKTQNCYNFGLHANIYMKFCVLMASYVTNHTNIRTYHLVLVIAVIKHFKNLYNFVPNMNICITFIIWIAKG